MLTDNDLKSYIKGYLADRKITYTRLDKHDRAIEVLINENERLNNIINKAIEYIDNSDILDIHHKNRHDLLDILKGEDNDR